MKKVFEAIMALSATKRRKLMELSSFSLSEALSAYKKGFFTRSLIETDEYFSMIQAGGVLNPNVVDSIMMEVSTNLSTKEQVMVDIVNQLTNREFKIARNHPK
jgi:hypothetical protein